VARVASKSNMMKDHPDAHSQNIRFAHLKSFVCLMRRLNVDVELIGTDDKALIKVSTQALRSLSLSPSHSPPI
jgi:hypothetical protein